jgi:UDP-N-acetylglucosamine:LPS N-acetylglucosamine transferase
MTKIVIACFDAGGGHRAAAKALAETIRRQDRAWTTKILNVDDILEPADPLYHATGTRGCELYNWTLRRGWTAGSAQIIPIMHSVIRLLHSRQVQLLRRCWRELTPDLVISVIPHFNRALYESLMHEKPATPFVTVVTDFADYPPHFWFETQDQHFICGSELAIEQARSVGARADRIWRVSGMILHPRFYEPVPEDRLMERCKIGLDPETPVGLVSFGGYGSNSMIKIAQRIAEARMRIQLIFLCGRNQDLFNRMRALDLPFPVHIQNLTDKVAHYMWLSDFFIGKPGPGSVSEALAMGLPVIVEAGLKTMAQERYNIQWILEQGVGTSIKRINELPKAVAELLQPADYARMRQRIDKLANRAVFEIPEVLNQILQPWPRRDPVFSSTLPDAALV